MLRWDATARRTTGLNRLELAPVGNAPADIIDNFAQGDAHWHFDQTGILDLAG